MTLLSISPDQSSLAKETYEKYVTWNSTKVKGLKGIPTLANKWDDKDWIQELPFNWHPIIKGGNGQFSQANKDFLAELVKNRPNADLFVEIGTASAYDGSSTDTFITNKKLQTKFITIDCECRQDPNLNESNVYFLVERSTNEKIKEHLGNHKIDILFIDGDHSVKTVFEEYEFYLPYMKEDGVIVLHDTNLHPGPYLLMEAIDEKVFRKEKLHLNDLGLGVIYLK
jgi:hypothetical protein